jgi:uncharacterized protein YndB with AHSA1/START domain
MPDASRVVAADRDEADCTLVIERIFNAPPDEVFAAWTDPAILVRWWGPEGHSTPECDMDVRPGGAWRTKMSGPDGDHIVSGVYREIAPPSRLVMTWGWQQKDGTRGHETVVAITLQPADGGTRMRLVQSLFLSKEQRDLHNWGWTSSLNDLERMFE